MRGRQVKLTSRIQRLKIIDNYSARRCEPRVRSIYMYANSPAQFTASLSRSRRTIAVTSASFQPSPVQFASIRPTYEGRTINAVNLQDLYFKKQFNLVRAEKPKNPSRWIDPAKLRPRQDRFSPRTFRKSGRSKKISISLFRPGSQTASFGQRPVIYGAVTKPTYTGGYEPPNWFESFLGYNAG